MLDVVVVVVPDVVAVVTTRAVLSLGVMSLPTARAFNRPCVPLLTDSMMPFAPNGDDVVMILLLVIVTFVVPESARAQIPTAPFENFEFATCTTEVPGVVGSEVVKGALS